MIVEIHLLPGRMRTNTSPNSHKLYALLFPLKYMSYLLKVSYSYRILSQCLLFHMCEHYKCVCIRNVRACMSFVLFNDGILHLEPLNGIGEPRVCVIYIYSTHINISETACCAMALNLWCFINAAFRVNI